MGKVKYKSNNKETLTKMNIYTQVFVENSKVNKQLKTTCINYYVLTMVSTSVYHIHHWNVTQIYK